IKLCYVLCAFIAVSPSYGGQTYQQRFSAEKAYQQIIANFFQLNDQVKFSIATLKKVKQAAQTLSQSFASAFEARLRDKENLQRDEDSELNEFLALLSLTNQLVLPEHKERGFEFYAKDLNPEVEDVDLLIGLIFMSRIEFFNVDPSYWLDYCFSYEEIQIPRHFEFKPKFKPGCYEASIADSQKKWQEVYREQIKSFFEEEQTFAEVLKYTLKYPAPKDLDEIFDWDGSFTPEGFEEFKRVASKPQGDFRAYMARTKVADSYRTKRKQSCVEDINNVFNSPHLSTQFALWSKGKTEHTLSYEDFIKGAALSQNLLYSRLLSSFIQYTKSAPFKKQQEHILAAERKLEDEKALALAKKHGFMEDTKPHSKNKKFSRKGKKRSPTRVQSTAAPEPSANVSTAVAAAKPKKSKSKTSSVLQSVLTPAQMMLFSTKSFAQFKQTQKVHYRVLRWSIPYKPETICQFNHLENNERAPSFAHCSPDELHQQWVQHQAFQFLPLTQDKEMFEHYFVGLGSAKSNCIRYLAHAAFIDSEGEVTQGFIIIAKSEDKQAWFHAKFHQHLGNMDRQEQGVREFQPQLPQVNLENDDFTLVNSHQLEVEDSGVIRLRFADHAEQLVLFPLR
ncbi:MAG: hypothetical protein OXT67_13465, partial [Zetaproteobacteria bacterium]|nr:hypothetical protein [Zetaproteobacteria bacterium]